MSLRALVAATGCCIVYFSGVVAGLLYGSWWGFVTLPGVLVGSTLALIAANARITITREDGANDAG